MDYYPRFFLYHSQSASCYLYGTYEPGSIDQMVIDKKKTTQTAYMDRGKAKERRLTNKGNM